MAALAAAALLLLSGSTRGRPDPAPERPTPASFLADDLTVAWIGHASVLIDLGGTRILTDPAFFNRIGLSLGPVTVGPRRLVEPALDVGELPPLDAIVLSHAHMDSLDRPSLRALASTPLVVTPRGTGDLIDDLGHARVVELDWEERVEVGPVTVEAFQVRHWGGRWPWSRGQATNGYIIRRDDTALLFAPDTAYTEAVSAAALARGVTAAIIGTGAYDPWIGSHADPEQVWRMFSDSGADYLLPIHWGTFRLGREPDGDAMTRLRAAAGPLADRIVLRHIGGTWRLADRFPGDGDGV